MWCRTRRLSALSVVVGASAALATLAQPWHQVRATTVTDGTALLGALYVGPDYRASPDQRSAQFERGLGEVERICTGLQHLDLGPWPWLVLGLLLALATATFLCPPGRATLRWTIGSVAASVAAVVMVQYGSMLAHVLETTGNASTAARVFVAGLVMVVGGALALSVTAIAELRRRRQGRQ